MNHLLPTFQWPLLDTSYTTILGCFVCTINQTLLDNISKAGKSPTSSSHQFTVQSAVKNITKTINFANKWTHVSSLEKTLTYTYKLCGISITKVTISRHLGKPDFDITNLVEHYESGIYKAINRKDVFYYFQDGSINPPLIPKVFDNDA